MNKALTKKIDALLARLGLPVTRRTKPTEEEIFSLRLAVCFPNLPPEEREFIAAAYRAKQSVARAKSKKAGLPSGSKEYVMKDTLFLMEAHKFNKAYYDLSKRPFQNKISGVQKELIREIVPLDEMLTLSSVKQRRKRHDL